MRIEEWNQRYAGRETPEDFNDAPTPLVAKTASAMEPGSALDLACGTGRNSIWLARNGWRVAAIDGAEAAIDYLRERASRNGVEVDARVADLESPGFVIEPASCDLILGCYYLERSLFERMRLGTKPGGVVLSIVHITAEGEAPTYKRACPGELRQFFAGWEILHDYEGPPRDPAHRRRVAEIVARKPARGQRGPVSSRAPEPA